MTVDPSTAESAASAVGRLRWRSRRGMLELELALQPFVEQRLASLSAADRERYARLLEHALATLRPRAVRLSTSPANLSCGVSATSQFGRWADCVEMVREYEAAHAVQVSGERSPTTSAAPSCRPR